MKVLEHLEPKQVFGFFEEMCAIPHGSRNTKAISDWCVAFAKERGLEYHQDSDNNVIIIKEGTPGYENMQPMIIQGHLDMVCAKTAECTKDMRTEGLDLVIDGDFVRAEGTTLGGDDGIAIAMALALLDSKDIAHPRLEAVFTVDEEIGLLGAASIDVSPLKGRQMINIDSEEEGIFTVSCAGGNTIACVLPMMRAAYSGTGLKLTVEGLTGGHSGAEIHKGRANSNVLMGRLLQAAAAQSDLRILRVDGGLKDNAIPVSSTAYIVVEDADSVYQQVQKMEQILKNEYRATEPTLSVRVECEVVEGQPLDSFCTDKVICMLMCLPDGVQAMSTEIAGLVQTSLNLGILSTSETELRASFCVRSSVDSQKDMLKQRLSVLMTQLGGHIEVNGDYSGWQYQEESPLRERMIHVFEEQYGKSPKVEAIHAGLECGMFAGKIPGLDCISIGPDLFEIHTPREKLSISSVQRLWKFMIEVLKRAQ